MKDSFREKVEKKLRKLDRFFDDEAKAVVTVTNEIPKCASVRRWR